MLTKEEKLLYEKQAMILKALSHPIRVAILDFLNKRPKCVCHIAEHVGAERSNVSRHLAVMVNAGILSFEKKGLEVIYELKMPCAAKFFACTTACVKQAVKENETLLRAL